MHQCVADFLLCLADIFIHVLKQLQTSSVWWKWLDPPVLIRQVNNVFSTFQQESRNGGSAWHFLSPVPANTSTGGTNGSGCIATWAEEQMFSAKACCACYPARRRTKRISPFLLRKVWDGQTSCTARWSLSCKGRAARQQRLSSAHSKKEACGEKRKMKLEPNRETCVFGL